MTQQHDSDIKLHGTELRTSRPRWLNAMVLLCSVALCCALGEAAARHLHLSRTWDSYIASSALQYRLRSNHEIGYRYQPGATWIGSRGVRYAINSEGFRERQPSADCNCPQIAFLGDSVTEGFGVEAGERFSALAEQALERAGTPTTCLNYGIASHATIDEAFVLATDLATRRIDVVVLQVGFNDLERNARVLAGTPPTARVSDAPAFQTRWLQRHSALYLALAERYNLVLLRRGGVNDLLSHSQAIDDQTWEPTRRQLSELIAMVRGRSLSLIVFYAPLDAEVQAARLAGRSALGDRLASLCEDEQVTFVAVGAALARARHESLFLDDVHFTPRGHEVVAATLHAPLLDAIAAARVRERTGSDEVSLGLGGRGRRQQSTTEGMQ